MFTYGIASCQLNLFLKPINYNEILSMLKLIKYVY